MSLKEYTTAELLEEVARRANENEAEEITHWCDECDHFTPKPDADHKYNPCAKKHKVKFHVPVDWGEAMSQQYGFYRLVCRDRT